MLKILTIDWDFFFPDSLPYDWGHQENPFFLEAIWSLRLTARNQITGEEAFSKFVPTIPANFWKKIIKGEMPTIFLAESHASIAAILDEEVSITNLDAHHDCGYYPNPELECGNWAWYLRDKIKEYHLCYPEWRRKNSDGEFNTNFPLRKPDSITYGLPEPAEYDAIFICRSGCWTPPWFDDKFQSWVKRSGAIVQPLDKVVWTKRSPNMKAALPLKIQLDESYKELRKKIA